MCTTKKNNIVDSIFQNKLIKNKNKKYQIACINKFSSKMLNLFFPFMKNYFIKNGVRDTWEIVLNKFIEKRNIKLYLYKSSKYWFNINTIRDLNKAKIYFKQKAIS